MGSEILWLTEYTAGARTRLPHSKLGFFSLNSEFSDGFLASCSHFRSGTPSVDIQKFRNPLNVSDRYCKPLCEESVKSAPLLPTQIKRKFETCCCGILVVV